MTVRAHSMFTTFDPTSNAVITAATVNIYNPGTVTPISATIFDKNGNPLSNPLTSDATTGLIDFYLTVAQEVDVVVSKTGFTTRTYSNVPVLDDSSLELTALLTTTGDLPYASNANTPARLPIGGTGSVMYVSSGVPSWNANLSAVAAGNLGIGTAAGGGNGILMSGTGITTVGNNAIGISVQATMPTASNIVADYACTPTTAASSVVANLLGLYIAAASIGGSGTVTNAYGIQVNNMGASGVTNAYGVYIAAQSGASTTNIGLYCNAAVQLPALGAFASGDKYVIVDASGNLHKSAIGPGS